MPLESPASVGHAHRSGAKRWREIVGGLRDDDGADAPARSSWNTGAPAPGDAPQAQAFPPTDWNGATSRERSEVYGALDLGTNNCRLLLARPSRRGFRVIDAFSRIIRLGEGVSQTRTLSEAAMTRTIEALKVCAGKIARSEVRRARLVATEACRAAGNSAAFLARVHHEVGLTIEILTPEAEAKLAVSGCASLIDPQADFVLVFDIGGGSSELIWLDLRASGNGRQGQHVERFEAPSHIVAWTSLPLGVVTLAEKFGGRHVTPQSFEAMVAHVCELVAPFEAEHGFARRIDGARVHLLGTSGTVTTVAGIKLGLPRYDRARVDGCWLDVPDVKDVTQSLLSRSYEQRVAEPCIGHDRADLVLAGCAILEAILRTWPTERLRVADRGLREGILATLMREDGVYRSARRRR
jgi:exopolyphosphatase/guanosine-5'-triphosphate,3'-diphosphate pyrophosphatase